MLLVGHAEQVVRLDELEPLVHERGRVDGDLRPHGPVGMSERLLRGDGGQLRGRAAAERAARSRQEKLLERARRAGGRGVRAGLPPARGDALEERAVLAVHGQDGQAAAAGGVQDERPAGHHALLVGQRERGSGLERRHGGAQSGGADHSVQHRERRSVGGGALGGAGDELADAGFAGVHRELRRQRRGLRRRVRVVQAHLAHAVRARLLDDPGGAAPGRQPHEAQLRHRRQHLERLAAYRPGRAEDQQMSGSRFGHARKGTTSGPRRRSSATACRGDLHRLGSAPRPPEPTPPRKAREHLRRCSHGGLSPSLESVVRPHEHGRIIEAAARRRQLVVAHAVGRQGVHDERGDDAMPPVVAHRGLRELSVRTAVEPVGVGGDTAVPVEVEPRSLVEDDQPVVGVRLARRSAGERVEPVTPLRRDRDPQPRSRVEATRERARRDIAHLELELEHHAHSGDGDQDEETRARPAGTLEASWAPPRLIPAASPRVPTRGRHRRSP